MESKLYRIVRAFEEKNEWVKTLSEKQKDVILEMMDDSYQLGFSDGFDEGYNESSIGEDI